MSKEGEYRAVVIDSCRDCPHCWKASDAFHPTCQRKEAPHNHALKPHLTPFPEWCPLPKRKHL